MLQLPAVGGGQWHNREKEEASAGLNPSSHSWTVGSTHGSRRRGHVPCPRLHWKRKSWLFWLPVGSRCVQCSRLALWLLPCPCLSPTLIVLAAEGGFPARNLPGEGRLHQGCFTPKYALLAWEQESAVPAFVMGISVFLVTINTDNY